MKHIIRLIRPQQWIKNGFIFVPMFFSGHLGNYSYFLSSFITFMAFCLVTSAIYILNDIVDVKADRRHPVKCHRPIASGKVKVHTAYQLMTLMIALSILFVCLLPQYVCVTGAIIAFYFVLNIAYCFKLKQYAILDVCIIAFGFVLRILAGGEALQIQVSNWLGLMTFLLTLFLSFAKRRDDVLCMNETGAAPRKNTSRYNLTLINEAITISATVTIVCYIMYTVSPEVTLRFHSQHLYLTSIFVIVGLLRYIQLTVVDKKSGDPTKLLLHDRVLQVIVVLWSLAFAAIIYLL